MLCFLCCCVEALLCYLAWLLLCYLYRVFRTQYADTRCNVYHVLSSVHLGLIWIFIISSQQYDCFFLLFVRLSALFSFFLSFDRQEPFWFTFFVLYVRLLLYKTILTTSAVSSTNFGSIVIYASCALHRSPAFTINNFHGSGPNIRLHCITLHIMHDQVLDWFAVRSFV